MSKFSKHLENYMNDREITVAELAAETGMDRVTLYRYIKGTRTPSDVATVEKILDALRIRVAEKQEFLEEYDRLILGEQVVDSYQYVNKLLKELKYISQNIYLQEHTWKEFVEMPLNENVIVLNSQKEIELCVISLYEEVFKANDQDASIHFLMQPTYAPIQELMVSSFLGKNIKIEQIVCLEQSIQKSYRNLEVFRQLLPACFADMDYEVRYYYSYLTEHINEMSWMPNVILSGSYVLCFDYNMEKGIFVNNKDYASLMHEQYAFFRKNSEPFLIKTEGLDCTQQLYKAMLGDFKDSSTMEDKTVNTLFVQPCLGMCVSSDVYEEYLHPLPMKEYFIQGMAATRGDWDGLTHLHSGENLPLDTVNYFQLSGLKDFMEHGRIREFPSGFYKPLSQETCKTLLKRMFVLLSEGNMKYKILSDQVEMPSNMCFYLGGDKRMFMNLVKDDAFIQIQIVERGICQVFSQYLKYLEDKRILSDSEEAEVLLKEFAKEYGIEF